MVVVFEKDLVSGDYNLLLCDSDNKRKELKEFEKVNYNDFDKFNEYITGGEIYIRKDADAYDEGRYLVVKINKNIKLIKHRNIHCGKPNNFWE